MIHYICKYTPVELFAGFWEKCLLFKPAPQGLADADKLVHPNICSFSRALLQDSMQNGSTLVFTDCCDSMRRIYDIIKQHNGNAYWLNLPHKQDQCSKLLYKNQLLMLIKEYELKTGKNFDCDKFRSAFDTDDRNNATAYISIMGARVSDELLNNIADLSPLPVVNNTCTGIRKIGHPPQTDDLDELMIWYAGELLSQTACMRMEDVFSRRVLTQDPNLKGIIYHTVKFCDYYGLEYADLKNKLHIPLVNIETDWMQQNKGQIMTRLQAFFETLCHKKLFIEEKKNVNITQSDYTAGIDIGSTTTNVVILKGGKKLVSALVIPTGTKGSSSAERAFYQAIEMAGISEQHIANTVTTGYGRANITFRGKDVTEITCHAKGAYFLDPAVRTVIDIGGQDSKVIRLTSSGEVKDFVMNDKCAAGTGRFLEMMAHSLGLDLAAMSTQGLKWGEEITISSMCSVFAESEVVSLLADNKRIEDIIHGLNKSVASRIFSLIKRLGMQGRYMMTGGVAQNAGVVKEIESMLGKKIIIPQQPEICGALGAALIAAGD
ncbi:MAG: acyl-CoA dehydratase activase [Bacillota bacterium]|jgi:predicted CoA-substrate-specific enzyme activase